MRSVIETIIREAVLGLLFFLPPSRRTAIERRIRGRFEWQKLHGCDVVVVSFGKSGRTWLRVMMSRVYQVKHALPARLLLQYDNMHRRAPAVPKVHFSHDNYLKDYTGNEGDKSDYRETPVVLLVRHPADTAVSQYFQWKYRMRDRKKRINDYPGGLAEVPIDSFVMDPKAGLAKVIEFMNLWAREMPRMKALLLIRYEDMRADPGASLARVMEFVGTPADEAEIAEAVDFASVENMRAMESKRTFWLSGSRMTTRDSSNPDAFKVRRAKVGGWRDYFEPAQVAEIEAYVAEHLDPSFGYGP